MHHQKPNAESLQESMPDIANGALADLREQRAIRPDDCVVEWFADLELHLQRACRDSQGAAANRDSSPMQGTSSTYQGRNADQSFTARHGNFDCRSIFAN